MGEIGQRCFGKVISFVCCKYCSAFTLVYVYSALSYLVGTSCPNENKGVCIFAAVVYFMITPLPLVVSCLSCCACFVLISDNINKSLTCLGITNVFVVIHLVMDIILLIVALSSSVRSLVTNVTLLALACSIIINILILICFGLSCVGQCGRKIKCRERRSELPFERSELPLYAEILARVPAKNKRLQKPTPVITSTNTQKPTPVIKSTYTQKHAICPTLIEKDMLFSNQNIERDNPVEIRAIQPAFLERDILFSNQNIGRDNPVEIHVIQPVYYEIPAWIPQTLPDSPAVPVVVESVHSDSPVVPVAVESVLSDSPDPDPVVSKHPNSPVYHTPDSPVVPVAIESVHSDSPDPDPDPVVSKHPNSPVYDIPDSPVYHTPDSPVYDIPDCPVYHTPDSPVVPVAVELVHSDSPDPDPDPDPAVSKHPNSPVYDIPDSLVVPVAVESVHSDSPDPVVSKHPNSSVYDIPDSPVTVQPLSKGF